MALEPISVPHAELGTALENAGHTGGTIGVTRQGSGGLGTTSAETDAFSRELSQSTPRMPGSWPHELGPLGTETETAPRLSSEAEPAAVREGAPAETAQTTEAEPLEPGARPAGPVNGETQALLDRLEASGRWDKASATTGYGAKAADRLEARVNSDPIVALQKERLDSAVSKLHAAGVSGDEEKIATASKDALDAAKDLDSARKDLEKMVATGTGNSISRITTPAAAAVGVTGLATSLGLGIYTADQLHNRLKESQKENSQSSSSS